MPEFPESDYHKVYSMMHKVDDGEHEFINHFFQRGCGVLPQLRSGRWESFCFRELLGMRKVYAVSERMSEFQ